MDSEDLLDIRNELAQGMFRDWMEERSGMVLPDEAVREVAHYAVVAANIFVEELEAAGEAFEYTDVEVNNDRTEPA